MIGQLLVINQNGESLIIKKYRNDDSKTEILTTFNTMRRDYTDTTLPPYIGESSGTHFYQIKRQSLYFVATTSHKMLPIYIIEVLTRIYQLFKDFCGVVNEDSLIANIVLIHELLDEVIDNGYPQLTTTEKLKPYIQSDPAPVVNKANLDTSTPSLFGIEFGRPLSGSASDKPVIESKEEKEMRKNEIFLDLIERVTLLMNANGGCIHCEVNGKINMKSFLVGRPQVRVGLNEDLSIGKEKATKGYGRNAHVDTCSFHQSVQKQDFNQNRILNVQPPDGEFSLMTYQLQGDLPRGHPFKLFSHIENEDNQKDFEVSLKLRCEIPPSCQAVNITLTLPLPSYVTGVSQQLSSRDQAGEFNHNAHKFVWNIKKMMGKSEVSAFLKVISPSAESKPLDQLGPAALNFEISGYVCSNMKVRFLRVFDRDHSYVPLRWIRYITVPDSYVIKLV